jgi:hypothetical protein
MSSCISLVLASSIIFFMISLLFLLFSLYHYNKYVRIDGKLTGNSNDTCKTENANCVEVKIIDPDNNNEIFINVLLDKNIVYNVDNKVTIYYDNTIPNLYLLNSKNAFIGNDLFINTILFFGIFLLLLSIITFILSFPPEYFIYNKCALYTNRIQSQ